LETICPEVSSKCLDEKGVYAVELKNQNKAGTTGRRYTTHDTEGHTRRKLVFFKPS
jgi:hypothetical protein